MPATRSKHEDEIPMRTRSSLRGVSKASERQESSDSGDTDADNDEDVETSGDEASELQEGRSKRMRKTVDRFDPSKVDPPPGKRRKVKHEETRDERYRRRRAAAASSDDESEGEGDDDDDRRASPGERRPSSGYSGRGGSKPDRPPALADDQDAPDADGPIAKENGSSRSRRSSSNTSPARKYHFRRRSSDAGGEGAGTGDGVKQERKEEDAEEDAEGGNAERDEGPRSYPLRSRAKPHDKARSPNGADASARPQQTENGKAEESDSEVDQSDEFRVIEVNRPGLRPRRVKVSVKTSRQLEVTSESEEEEEEDGDQAADDAEDNDPIASRLRRRKRARPQYYAPQAPKRQTGGPGGGNGHRRTPREFFSKRRSRRRRRERYFRHDSSSSSSSSSSDDEKHGKSRKRDGAKHHGLPTPKPINLSGAGSISAQKADIDPMTIDPSISWDSVGGLDHHVRSLKEMVMFPLLYPEVFERFSITPPRGVLFYGPPGTGKTLVARALANTCSSNGQRVSFFMRKGADCLSKWVGEAERQLRLLFNQAYQMQPSIIFFDEIDGLAPVRSSKQDQIHSSIVSTLLALMDGLDSRGQVCVIGATNRIDAIDPALRRPGRFDREFLFTLPTKQARRQIISIQTQKWQPPLPEPLKDSIADLCVGYCGADLKALCTEAALRALRSRYPQIYSRQEKLQIDPTSIQVTRAHFLRAMRDIVPASHRAAASYAKALSPGVAPLLENPLNEVMAKLKDIFPCFRGTGEPDPTEDFDDSLDGDSTTTEQSYRLLLSSSSRRSPAIHRPRFLIAGPPGMGQAEVVAAVMDRLEEFPVSSLDMATLLTNPIASSIDEAFVIGLREALRKVPSVVFIPHLDAWWMHTSQHLRDTVNGLLQDIDPSLPVLLLATSDIQLKALSPELLTMFGKSYTSLQPPDDAARMAFFAALVKEMSQVAVHPSEKVAVVEDLPVVSPPPPRELSEAQRKARQEEEEHALRELRIFLRELLQYLGKERKFQLFFKPVDRERYPDYYEIIKTPLDLGEVLARVDDKYYRSPAGFLEDIDMIVDNAIEYNPKDDPMQIVGRAKALRDLCFSLVERLDSEVTATLERLAEREGTTGKIAPPGVGAPSRPALSRAASSSSTRSSSRLRGSDLPDELLHMDPPEIVRPRRLSKVLGGTGGSVDANGTVDEETIVDEEPGEDGTANGHAAAFHTRRRNSKVVTDTPSEASINGAAAMETDKPADSTKDAASPPSPTVNGPLIDSGKVPVGRAPPSVVIDRDRALTLQASLIAKTAGFAVEHLLSLRARIYKLVENHRYEADKSALLDELERLMKSEKLL